MLGGGGLGHASTKILKTDALDLRLTLGTFEELKHS